MCTGFRLAVVDYTGGGVCTRAGLWKGSQGHPLEQNETLSTNARLPVKRKRGQITDTALDDAQIFISDRQSGMPDRSRELKAESSPLALIAREGDSTIMQLDRPVRHRKADPRPSC